jgi:heat shock protein HslJ
LNVRRSALGLAIVAAAVALALMTSTTHAQIPAEVVGVEWQWRGTLFANGSIVRPADPASYTLQFEANETATVQADCNIGGGDYTTAATSATGGAMRIGPVVTTLIACEPGSLDSFYLRQLDQVTEFRVLGDDLILIVGSGIGWMRFTRAATTAAPSIIGRWQWRGTLMNDGTAIVPTDSSRYTLELMADGRAVIRADCNMGNGPFTVAGNQISLGPFALTRALCPPGSLDTRFVRQLESVVSYLIVGGDLVLELPFDSGGMRFSPGATPFDGSGG